MRERLRLVGPRDQQHGGAVGADPGDRVMVRRDGDRPVASAPVLTDGLPVAMTTTALRSSAHVLSTHRSAPSGVNWRTSPVPARNGIRGPSG